MPQRRKYRRPRPARKARKGAAPRRWAGLKKAVQALAEKKTVRYQSANLELANAANTAAFGANCINLVPSSGTYTIAQGVGQGQRIGNKVGVKRAILRLTMQPLPYNLTSNSVPVPQVVVGYLFSLKSVNAALSNAQAAVNGSGGFFFQNGNASIGFRGTLSDYQNLVNKDVITPYKRFVFKVGAQHYSSNTGNQANLFNYTNNDFKMCALSSTNVTKWFPKTLRFEDGFSDTQCRQLFAVFGPADADGGINASGFNAIPLNWSYTIDLDYTDM